MSDIYAEMGAGNAVLSEPSEGHNDDMASLPVSVRDGDDEIIAVEEPEENQEEGEEAGSQSEEDGNIEVQINTDGEEQGEPEEAQEGSAEFEPVGDAPDELVKAAESVAQNESAFNDMVADAAARGLPQEDFEAIVADYNEKGSISPAAYEKLAAIGYSKNFIDSYIAGQEAQATAYANAIVNYAGGEEKFNAVYTHLAQTDAAGAQALVQAMESGNLPLVKTLINLAGQSFTKSFGKPAARTVTKQAKPVTPKAPQKEGFATKADMTKAMSDRRYGVDPAYTRSVEAKVIASDF